MIAALKERLIVDEVQLARWLGDFARYHRAIDKTRSLKREIGVICCMLIAGLQTYAAFLLEQPKTRFAQCVARANRDNFDLDRLVFVLIDEARHWRGAVRILIKRQLRDVKSAYKQQAAYCNRLRLRVRSSPIEPPGSRSSAVVKRDVPPQIHGPITRAL